MTETPLTDSKPGTSSLPPRRAWPRVVGLVIVLLAAFPCSYAGIVPLGQFTSLGENVSMYPPWMQAQGKTPEQISREVASYKFLSAFAATSTVLQMGFGLLLPVAGVGLILRRDWARRLALRTLMGFGIGQLFLLIVALLPLRIASGEEPATWGWGFHDWVGYDWLSLATAALVLALVTSRSLRKNLV